MPAQVTRDQVEALVNSGLRNMWYPVCASDQVAAIPVGLTRLGERIALWRDKAGQVHAIEDRCPHRGARLSLGWNLGDRVACWYHGVEVDKTGLTASVPAFPGCAMEGKRHNRSYPVQERHGAIFMWFGDKLHGDPAPLVLPEEMGSEEWSSFLCTAHWKCNWRYATENVMDPMHGAYLHSASHSMAEGDKTAVMRARETELGFVFEKEGQMGVNFDWTEFAVTGAAWMKLSIPYRKAAGPGGPFFIVGFVTPVDATNCRVFFWRCRKVQGWQRDSWRFLYRTWYEGQHWEVLEQDRVVLEMLPDDARKQEILYQHDAGLVRLRRIWDREARAQLTALAEADAQPAAAD